VAKQHELVDAERVGDVERVGCKPFQRVLRRVGGLVARAVSTVIERDDGM
jgi:hypothetical protein